jgi:hypothetical protein
LGRYTAPVAIGFEWHKLIQGDQMETTNYEGYEIVAKPNQLTNGTWSLNIVIVEHRGDQTNTKPFSASNTFQSQEEAIQQCLEFGKRIIDGDVKGCSLEKV